MSMMRELHLLLLFTHVACILAFVSQAPGNASQAAAHVKVPLDSSNAVLASSDEAVVKEHKEKAVPIKRVDEGEGRNESRSDCRTLDQMATCMKQMYEDRRDTSEFVRSLEVACCIYAKFIDCVTPLAVGCRNDTIALLENKVLQDSKLFDSSCKRYEYPSARCWIFFHQYCFFASLFMCLLGFGIFLAAAATRENRRRHRLRCPDARDASIAMSRVNETGMKPHLEFPPPPSYEECVENRV